MRLCSQQQAADAHQLFQRVVQDHGQYCPSSDAGQAKSIFSLFPEVKHLKKPQPDHGFTLLREPDAIPVCSDGDEEDPVVQGAHSRGLHLYLLLHRKGREEQRTGQRLPGLARTENTLFIIIKYLQLIHKLLSIAFCD